MDSSTIERHQVELLQNQEHWRRKPLLRDLYHRFYKRILGLIDPALPGQVVEIGSGIGNLKSHLPAAIRTDLFPNPWLDLVCDGYELPFPDHTISHLVLFDVFHHLRAPKAFLKEARRALTPGGRLILFEPYISLASLPVYGLLHPEPVANEQPINLTDSLPRPRDYYAAQGNATRIFFRNNPESKACLDGWTLFHTEAFSAFSYLLSGGYSKPCLYPKGCLDALLQLDCWLSRWPKFFGARCLVGLQPNT